MHGADDRTIQYADSDAEWRHGGPISPRALRRDASQQVLQLDSEVAASGDATAPKTSYDTTMPPDGRDALADFASACEGKGRAWRAEGDAAVRLEWREAKTMNADVTATMARMSLTLHDTIGFTDACATDGSFAPRGEAGEGLAAWGVWHGVGDDGTPTAYGGALPPGSSIADAELTAIDACMLRAEASPRGTEAPRLLILSDCNPAIEAVQTAEQTGSAWHLYKHHRPALLERISLRAARWRRAGGDLVIQWVCAHCGVFPNHYADVVAKAYLGRKVEDPYDGKLAREASLIAYGPQRRDGTVSWAGGQRKLRGLVQQGLERFTIREAITSAGHDVGNLIVHMPEELPHAWPWEHGGAWTELLESTGRASDGGGSKLQATSLGAIMRVRSGQLGLGELDYKDDAGRAAMEALAEVWRAPRGRQLAGELVHSLEMLYDIIERPEGGGSSAYKGAVKQALDVAAALTTAGNNLPSVEQWRRFRAAASGALPAPTQRERAATRARMAATGYVPPPTRGGRDGERLTAMQVAVREATNAARKAAKTITWTAIEWRKTNAPEWRGGAAGEQDGDDDDDVDDDDGDDRSQPVPEEEPTDDEGAGEEWDRRMGGSRAGSNSDTRQAEQPSPPPRTASPRRDTSGGAHSGGQGDAEPSIRVVVAGSRRAETRDTGADTVPRPLPVNIMRGTGLGNPFPMGKRGTDEALRDQVCEAFDTWLRLRTVPASAVRDTRSTPALIRQANGQPFSQEIAPRRSDEARTGNDAVVAMRAALNGRGNAKVVRLGCSPSCREGRLCHGDSLAAMARELIGVRDERRREGQQRGDAPKPRKPRADKGVPRGPRALKGTTAYQIGHPSLLRFRHGHERQVSQRTLDAVREAQGAGVEPWNTADSQGSQRAPRKGQRNRRAARRFLERLRFELLQGGSGGDGHRHPEDANDGDEDGERSEDEEMPDRTTEPGPSEQPPETGHPNEKAARQTTNLQ